MMSDDERMTPAEIIANRVGLGFTVKDLAAYMGVHHRTVYYWEAGRSTPPVWLAGAFTDLWELTEECVREIGYATTRGPITIARPGEEVIYDGSRMPSTWFCVVLGHVRLRYPGVLIQLKPTPEPWPTD